MLLEKDLQMLARSAAKTKIRRVRWRKPDLRHFVSTCMDHTGFAWMSESNELAA